MEPRTPSCSPGYRCHGSDLILISLNAVSCILERRSNGQCIIDRCKTGVSHLTDEVCVRVCAYQNFTGARMFRAPGMLVMVWGWFRTRYPSSSSLPEADAKSKGLGLDPGAPEVAQNTLFGRDGSIGDVTAQWTPEMRLHAQSPDHIAFQIESTPASSIGK